MDSEPFASVRSLDDRDQVMDTHVLFLGEHEREHRGVSIGRDQSLLARFEIGVNSAHTAATTCFRNDGADTLGKRWVRNDVALGAHDDHLVRFVRARDTGGN